MTPVTDEAVLPPGTLAPSAPPPTIMAPSRKRLPRWPWLAAAGMVVVALVVLGLTWRAGGLSATHAPPRWSIVVLPFENLGGDAKEAALADGITDDLTCDLARLNLPKVAGPASLSADKRQSMDVRQIGRALDVRYAVEGNVRRIGDAALVNVHLVSTETGIDLWSDRFDEPTTDPAATGGRIAERMRAGLSGKLLEVESARSLREHPDDPDVVDLLTRAGALDAVPPSTESEKLIVALLERALVLDPSNVQALSGSASLLTELYAEDGWGSFTLMTLVETRLAKARALAPDRVQNLQRWLFFLRIRGRCAKCSR